MAKKASTSDNRREVRELFKNLQTKLSSLEELPTKCSSNWRYEDPIYRFYHQSFKVYSIQKQTLEIVWLATDSYGYCRKDASGIHH